jgi:restriction system protein
MNIESQSLEEWLTNLALPEKKRTPLFAGFRFPTDRNRDEYIASIKNRSDKDIRFLLRHFLLEGGSLGIDQGRMESYSSRKDFQSLYESSEYIRRLMNQRLETWEGMTWILDLLPHHPATAIAAIEAYNLAHYYLLPDGRCHGLSDAVAVIRAKYIEPITEDNLAETVEPRDFEFLVAALYLMSDYKVEVTRQTRDGGHDIIATKDERGFIERILVECKCTRSPVPVAVARSLVGTLDEFHATRGVLVTTSAFTAPTVAFAKKLARIELIDHPELCRRFNAVLGPSWTSRVSAIVTEVKARLGRS